MKGHAMGRDDERPVFKVRILYSLYIYLILRKE